MVVGCDPDLPLLVDKGKESLVEDGPDVMVSGRKFTVKISDVSRGICVVPDRFPVVVPKKAVEPLVLHVVVMTRSQAGCAPALTLPVDEEMNSQVEVGPDMDMGDPDVERSNQVLLEVVPFVDGDGCPTRWLETEFDDCVMEKFVLLVLEMSTIGSMKSVVGPTFLPALSEVCSLAVLGEVGRECVLDLNTGETYTPVWSPQYGLKTIPPKPPFPPCRVVVRGCARMRGEWTFPGRDTRCAES